MRLRNSRFVRALQLPCRKAVRLAASCVVSLLTIPVIAAETTRLPLSVYNGDPVNPDIGGVWEVDPDSLNLPDYRKWLVDGKPIADSLRLSGLKMADGGVQGKRAFVPYTPPYMAAWNNRVNAAAAGRPIAGVGTYCWPDSVVGQYLDGPGIVETPKGVVGRAMFEVTQTPGRVLIDFPEGTVSRIYTDGRSHPDLSPEEHTIAGHIVGHWEDGVLVTDTVGIRKEVPFGDVLHSDAAHVVTRYSLTEDKRLDVRIHITDRKALTKPVEIKLRFRRLPAGEELPEDFCELAGGTVPGADGYQSYEPLKPSPGWDLPDD
ncbi:MAG: hypothetical protein QM696_06870 [Steroidobacteraceae bacterium]